jgi:hypothetical protein
LPRKPALFLAFDATKARPAEPGPDDCAMAPMFWTPNSGIHHGDATLGVRWFCERCGIEGPPEFGPARNLTWMSQRSEVAFYKVAQAACRCPNWQEWEDERVGPALKVYNIGAVAWSKALEERYGDE